jgi:hypothetical protein
MTASICSHEHYSLNREQSKPMMTPSLILELRHRGGPKSCGSFDKAAKGEVLALVEADESLRIYEVKSDI